MRLRNGTIFIVTMEFVFLTEHMGLTRHVQLKPSSGCSLGKAKQHL